MAISIVNGSPRANGATGKILQEIRHVLTGRYKATVHYYDLSKMRVDLCKGCEQCYRTGECCIKADDFEQVARQIKEQSDLLYITGQFTRPFS